MRRSSPGLLFALTGLVLTIAARCTEVTVQRTSDGTVSGVASGPEVNPVEIDNDGIREITPEPEPYEPVYPITPPPPTPTPRPR